MTEYEISIPDNIRRNHLLRTSTHIRLKQTVPRNNWCCYSCLNDVRGTPGFNIIEGTQEEYFTGYNKRAKIDIRYSIRFQGARDTHMCKDCLIQHIDGMKDFYETISSFKDMEDEGELIPHLWNVDKQNNDVVDEESK